MFEDLARLLVRGARSTVCNALGSFYSLLSQALYNAYWLMVGWEDSVYNLIEEWRELSYIWPLSAVVDWVLDRLYNLIPFTIGAVTWMFDYPIGWLNSLYDPMFGDWELVAWVFDGFCRLESWATSIGKAIDDIIESVWKWIIENVADLLDPIGFAVCEVESWLRYQDPTKPGYQYNFWNWYKVMSDNIFDAFLLAFRGVAEGILERVQGTATWFWERISIVFDPIGYGVCEVQRRVVGSDYNAWDWIKAQSPNRWEGVKTALEMLGDSILIRIKAEIEDLWALTTGRFDTFENVMLQLKPENLDDTIMLIIERALVSQAERVLNMAMGFLERVW